MADCPVADCPDQETAITSGLGPPEREPVGLIGVGRAGAAVGSALAAAGYPVVAVHVRTPGRRPWAAGLFPAARIAPADEVARAARVLVIAVPDDAIRPLIEDLARAGALRAGQAVAHLSGRHGLGVLRAAGAAGAGRMALHPIMTLPGTGAVPPSLAGVPFGLTADPGVEDLARRLVTDIGGIAVPVAEEHRDLYHAALVLGGNFTSTLAAAAVEILAAAGVPEPARALGPLLHASLDNALAAGWAASTGPVRRGDRGTVAAHRAALARVDPPAADLYLDLAAFTRDRLVRAGLLDPTGPPPPPGSPPPPGPPPPPGSPPPPSPPRPPGPPQFPAPPPSPGPTGTDRLEPPDGTRPPGRGIDDTPGGNVRRGSSR